MIHRLDRASGVDPRLLAWLDRLGRDAAFDVVVTAGIRHPDEQRALYAQGRTIPGPHASPAKPLGDIVTRAGPEDSAHCRGGAVDVAPFVGGKVPWNAGDPGYEFWAKLGEHAMIRGFTWGGCHVGGWAHFVDMPHVEVPDWRSLLLVP